MRAVYQSFEDVRALPERTLRDLLTSGDPSVRVWSAWALGLRLGPSFAGEAEALYRGEPSVGLRRHWVLILAGACDIDAVTAIAKHDQDLHVRTTAWRYAVQIATGDVATRVALEALDAAIGDPNDECREECLRLLAGRWPRERTADLCALLSDRSSGVRIATAALLSEEPVFTVSEDALAERIGIEDDSEVRKSLIASVMGFESRLASLRRLDAWPSSVIEEVLRSLSERRITLEWDRLAGLTARESRHLDAAILASLRSPSEASFDFLVDRAFDLVRFDENPAKAPPKSRDVAFRALDALLAKSAGEAACPAELRAKLEGLRDLASAKQAWWKENEDEDEDYDDEERFWGATQLALDRMLDVDGSGI